MDKELYEAAVMVLLVRMDGLIKEYQKLNRISDDSILLSQNIAREIKEKLNITI